MDWDAYRSVYGTLDFDAKQRHYDEVFRNHPAQEHHAADQVAAFLGRVVSDDCRVVTEMGGWRGELARKMLDKFPTLDWTNYDFCLPAIESPVFTDERYHPVGLRDYLWNRERIEGDIFVAAHVIEHLTADELAALIGKLDARHVYLEAPLLLPGQVWAGYFGDHVLDIGWSEVDDLMTAAGYEIDTFDRKPGDYDFAVATYRR